MRGYSDARPDGNAAAEVKTLRRHFGQIYDANLDGNTNPYEYLHDIYNRIMGHPVNRLDELLPAAWLRTRQSR